jgi:hypothetical protein
MDSIVGDSALKARGFNTGKRTLKQVGREKREKAGLPPHSRYEEKGERTLKKAAHKKPVVKTAAGIDFYDQWLGIQQKNNQRLHKEYTQLLKKVSKVMTQAGLKLDMSRSSVGSYNKGSDGRVMEGLLVFKDLAFDEVFLTRDEVRDWFEKHLDLYPQLTERSQGTWAADITAN